MRNEELLPKRLRPFGPRTDRKDLMAAMRPPGSVSPRRKERQGREEEMKNKILIFLCDLCASVCLQTTPLRDAPKKAREACG
jgi:hypothetical protein